MKELEKSFSSGKTIIKKCYSCNCLIESVHEPKRCPDCHKSFLPTNYFAKVHAKNEKEFDALFAHCDELHEQDLIRGLTVIW